MVFERGGWGTVRLFLYWRLEYEYAGMKNEHLSIESDLEYLIKPDVCPDWATHLTFVSKDSDKDFILPFTHLRIAQGKVGDRGIIWKYPIHIHFLM